MENTVSPQLSNNPFIDRMDIELKRAQRYQIFISLLVYDLSFLSDTESNNEPSLKDKILQAVTAAIRTIDNVTLLASDKIALLLPETNRQGAEIASKRITTVVAECLKAQNLETEIQSVSPQMASYPDAAGMKTIKDFLTDFSGQYN